MADRFDGGDHADGQGPMITAWNTATLGKQPTPEQLAAVTPQQVSDYYTAQATLGAEISLTQVQALPASYRSVMGELRRVTWPDRQQIKEMSIGVIVLSLGIGAVIALMDFILQQVLVRWIPQIFAGR